MNAIRSFVLAWSAAAVIGTSSATVQAADSGAIAGSTAQTAARAEDWRYKRHNGHWWYYRPDKTWLFWNGESWSPYSTRNYRSWVGGGRRAIGGSYVPGSRLYTWDPYAPYNTDAMTPSAHLGQAMTGGMSGPEGARTARVGENN